MFSERVFLSAARDCGLPPTPVEPTDFQQRFRSNFVKSRGQANCFSVLPMHLQRKPEHENHLAGVDLNRIIPTYNRGFNPTNESCTPSKFLNPEFCRSRYNHSRMNHSSLGPCHTRNVVAHSSEIPHGLNTTMRKPVFEKPVTHQQSMVPEHGRHQQAQMPICSTHKPMQAVGNSMSRRHSSPRIHKHNIAQRIQDNDAVPKQK